MATASTTDRSISFGAAAPRVAAPRAVIKSQVIEPPATPWWEGPDHVQFTTAFDAAQRRRLIEEDLFAGTSVAIVLTSVVTAGMLAMAVTVLFTLL